MSERVFVLAVLLGLGVEAWKGWGKNPSTPLPYPWLFTAWLVVIGILGIVATFAPPLAAVLAVGILIAILLGAQNPLVSQQATGAAA
jgi:uncharacterized membrane protein YoaK (UPF0700 family)